MIAEDRMKDLFINCKKVLSEMKDKNEEEMRFMLMLIFINMMGKYIDAHDGNKIQYTEKIFNQTMKAAYQACMFTEEASAEIGDNPCTN